MIRRRSLAFSYWHRYAGIGYFIVGFVFFSGLVSLIQLRILRMPLFLFEPVLLSTFLLLKWHTGYRLRSLLSYYGLTICLAASMVFCLLVLIAVTGRSNSDLIDAISSGRPYLFALFGVFIVPIIRILPVALMIAFLLGLLLGDLLNVFLSPFFREEWRGILHLNLMALFALNFLAARYSGVLFGCLVFGASLYIAFLSGFRINLIVSVFAFGLGILFRFFLEMRFREFFRVTLLFFAFPTIGMGLFYYIREFGREFMDPYAYIRVVNRMEGLLKGNFGASQDEERQQLTSKWLNYDYSVFPQGFVMRAENMVGHFNDFPPLYFLYNFGFFMGLIMILALFFLGFRHFLRVISRVARDPFSNMSAAFVLIFLFIFLVNGRFLYISQEAFLFGALIGPWLHFKKLRFFLFPKFVIRAESTTSDLK